MFLLTQIKGNIRLLLLTAALLISPAAIATDSSDAFMEQWQLNKAWKGDFDGMVKRRKIRVLVVDNPLLFFFDKAQIRGVSYDGFLAFEKFINKKLKTGTRKIKVVYLPVPRDKLLPWLIEGRGDIAAANLSITKARKKSVDFSRPVYKNVSEILITGPGVPAVNKLEELSGKDVYLRPSSSYYDHLIRLNRSFEKKGLTPVKIIEVSEYLEDADLLEMMNNGLISMTFVDDHKAKLWAQIFNRIKLHPQVTINSGGNIGWALRKNSPKLKSIVDTFVRKHQKGTRLGNILFKRYMVNNKWARNSLSPVEQKKFQALSSLFEKYSAQYDFDYLMMAALAYQESQLDHSSRSHVGAVGIMQILPSTAADKNVGIPDRLCKN